MADRHLQSVSGHALQRLAQRNLTYRDVEYVLSHGRQIRNGKALFIYLGRRDIPARDQRESAWARLEGTILVLDSGTGSHLTTAYRNRRHGIKDIKRKLKRSLPPTAFDA
jgi:hypothetical protein